MKTVFDKLVLFSVCLREDPEYNSCFVSYIMGVRWWLIDDFSFENANVIGYRKLPRPLVIPNKKNRAVGYWLIAFNSPSESWAKEEISVGLFSKGEVFEYCRPAWSCMSTWLPMRFAQTCPDSVGSRDRSEWDNSIYPVPPLPFPAFPHLFLFFLLCLFWGKICCFLLLW